MKRTLLALAAGAVALSASARAALIDFVAEAAGNERGVADDTTINFNGVDVTFSSLSAGSFFAYFDDLSSGKPGGLGVCTTLSAGPGSVCADPGDDNIRLGQAVTLTFGQTVDLLNFSFNDKDHNSLNGNGTNTLLIAINDPLAFVRYTFAEAVALTISGVDLIRFAFDGDSATGAQYYVDSFDASPVPLPAAAPLSLAGLAALAFATRKNRRREL